MKNIRLLIEYDGTNYHGWQRQKGHATLQEIIEDRLFRITGERAALISASRTDAGVHAIGQVASFKTNSHLEPLILRWALNATLPEDIRILNAEGTAEAFHPRYDALSKSYFYIISNTIFSSVFLYRYAWRVPYSLDLDEMKKAGDSLLGRHDFSAFRGAGCGAKSTVREITSLSIEKVSSIDFMTAKINGNFIKITVEANAFLRHMVRNILGTLVEIGRGEMTLNSVSEAIKLKDRKKTGPTAPAHGLFLEKVSYPDT
ncbi:MAG TPA: tRNA pseudouridine(38-40) synthase TruA [Nitrospiraceae bacterium]|nr:tRNA pseudouridine(38-40) synthase TruA [Nitrospiraceae bacterium]